MNIWGDVSMNQFENNTTPEESPILFIIGNGFDLGLNMKTRYEDVYATYITTPSKSDTITAFKNALPKEAPYEKWSDFEMGMAEYSKTLSSEDELIECVRDFKSHMVKHLQNENKKMLSVVCNPDYFDGLVKELNRSFREFYDCFSSNIIRQLDLIVDTASLFYPRIITFNYTTVLDVLLHMGAQVGHRIVEEPLHIHGTLNRDIVLGVDNIEQLQDENYSISNKGSRAFIKTFFNQEYDINRVFEARKMISDSRIICTYGFSMGESDKTWVSSLVDWIKENPDHHLIVYQYEKTEYHRYNFDEIMDAEEQKKEALFRKLNLTDRKLMDQIHIPVGYDIFNFTFQKTTSPSNITPGLYFLT